MSSRRNLSLPITIAVIMIVLLIVLIVGWVLITVWGATENEKAAPLYWIFLPIGATFLAAILAGVIFYMVVSIKAINLSQRQANFIDSVTHELKSPIASLKLYLQTLNRRSIPPEKVGAFYETMLEDIERLDHLINHLLEAGRLDRRREDAEEGDVRLDKVLAGCAQSVALLYRLPPNTIQVKSVPCTVRGLHGDIEIIFRNLIDNAVKYSGKDPEVRVQLRVKYNDEAVIEVTDNGPGIPFSQRRKIFGRFVRLGLELQREKPGTGLGLYLVRTLVRRMKGEVRVKDPPKGTGTVFVVTLPGAKTLAEAKAPEPVPV
ncbi:Sensor protein kinase WalK [Bremerella volcania]|uniref:histidine kinase n=1 Tax=Bremerella volcania TaxID=2527984 RepID=A0A518C7T9_9BACT|nr:HAMP domain-containing sensor histidine kinase [Bremerella volcania]QDU75270.1 Sensor protein kinase WalK [Bremerella volcania]